MIRLISINLCVLLGLVLITELVFGDWVSPRDFGSLNLPRNTVRTFDVESLYGGGKITYTRDYYGLRGDYGTLADIDILALGGSTTNELYVDDENIWTAVLQKRLRELNSNWSLANAGAEGQSTLGHLYNFEVWFPNLEGLKPKYVMAFIGVNDLHVEKHAHYDAITTDDDGRNLAQWFKNQSAIYRLYRVVRGIMEAREAKVVHGGNDAHRGPWQEVMPPDLKPDRDLKERIEDYEKRVGQLIERIKAFGASAIIVTQSRSDYRVDNGQVFAALKVDGTSSLGNFVVQSAFNTAAMTACRAHSHTICIDLGRELRFADDDFYDWVHTTASGSARIGNYLFEALKDQITPKD